MPSYVQNIFAVIIGLLVGMVVNMGLVTIGPMIVPMPEGADVSTMEGLAESMKLFTPANFIFPFLAHALGTLAGALTAAKLAASRKMGLALGIGGFFLLGGITMIASVGGPLWFCILDLVVAYIPMGWLGGKLAGKSESPVA